MEEYLFVMDKEKQAVTIEKERTVYYAPAENLDGDIVQNDADSSSICAKSVHKNNKAYFFVKASIVGTLYDPWMPADNLNVRKAKHAGRAVWDYKMVTDTCFLLYLKYLSSRNHAHLKNAEREMLSNATST